MVKIFVKELLENLVDSEKNSNFAESKREQRRQ